MQTQNVFAVLCLLVMVMQAVGTNQSVPMPYGDNAEYGDSLDDAQEKTGHENYVVRLRKPENTSGSATGIHGNILVSLNEPKIPTADFLKGIDIKTGAKKLSSHFVNLANTEMGVEKLQVSALHDILGTGCPGKKRYSPFWLVFHSACADFFETCHVHSLKHGKKDACKRKTFVVLSDVDRAFCVETYISSKSFDQTRQLLVRNLGWDHRKTPGTK